MEAQTSVCVRGKSKICPSIEALLARESTVSLLLTSIWPKVQINEIFSLFWFDRYERFRILKIQREVRTEGFKNRVTFKALLESEQINECEMLFQDIS